MQNTSHVSRGIKHRISCNKAGITFSLFTQMWVRAAARQAGSSINIFVRTEHFCTTELCDTNKIE